MQKYPVRTIRKIYFFSHFLLFLVESIIFKIYYYKKVEIVAGKKIFLSNFKGNNMSISKKVLKLRQSILKANTQINSIKVSGSLETSEEANIKYNRLLIEKAVCKKELENEKCSILRKFFNKFAHNPNKGKKLICDYFKS